MRIYGKRILTENGFIEKGYIEIENGRITEIGKGGDGRLTIIPALIDIHTHGGGGYDVMSGEIEKIAEYKRSEGVCLFCPTTMTEDIDKIGEIVKKRCDGVLGYFMEGPYISKKYKGVHNEEKIIEIDIKRLEAFIAENKKYIKRMLIAPEKENAIDAIRLLNKMA